jgi:hypothetical protein
MLFNFLWPNQVADRNKLIVIGPILSLWELGVLGPARPLTEPMSLCSKLSPLYDFFSAGVTPPTPPRPCWLQPPRLPHTSVGSPARAHIGAKPQPIGSSPPPWTRRPGTVLGGVASPSSRLVAPDAGSPKRSCGVKEHSRRPRSRRRAASVPGIPLHSLPLPRQKLPWASHGRQELLVDEKLSH